MRKLTNLWSRRITIASELGIGGHVKIQRKSFKVLAGPQQSVAQYALVLLDCTLIKNTPLKLQIFEINTKKKNYYLSARPKPSEKTQQRKRGSWAARPLRICCLIATKAVPPLTRSDPGTPPPTSHFWGRSRVPANNYMKSAELSRGRTRWLVKKLDSPAQFSVGRGKTRVLCLVLCWVSGAENKSPFSAEQRLQVKWIYWKHRVSEQGMNQEIVCIFRERRCRFDDIATFST